MDSKGRESLALLAEANLRLAALFRRQNQPEIAVPVLVEVVKLMTPSQAQAKHQSLVELGFVETVRVLPLQAPTDLSTSR